MIILFLFQFPALCFATVPDRVSTYDLIVLYNKGESPRELEEQITSRRRNAEKSDLYKQTYIISDFALRFAKKATLEQKLNRLLQTEQQTGVIARSEIPGDTDDKLTVNVLTLNGSYDTDTAALHLAMMPEVAYVEKQ